VHQRRQADAAVAGDHGGNALQQLRVPRGVLQQQAVVVRVAVDEAGRDDQAGGIDAAVRGGARELSDGGDAAARHAHIGAPP
jgi:hypothetical protein